ncbi:PDZ domain-containing protein, partial [Candidatus Woesearchaeota archaeon]|nr:PDZ domain-containing protein [Candidatus Woesearchaeota archaeon]
MPKKQKPETRKEELIYALGPLLLWFIALQLIPQHQWTMLFYSGMFFIIFFFRRFIDWQAPLIGLYRTKVGIKLMERWGKGHSKLIKVLGIIGVVVGFIGMIFITGMLVKGVWDIFFRPGAPPVVSPVIPGFTIPGTDLKIPLVTGWLALFIVIVIHEFSHGVVSKAYGIKVKSSGLLVFGPIGGAFVEPDEKKLEKESSMVKLSMFAAGPFSNIISAGVFIAIIGLLISPALSGMVTTNGVEIVSTTPGLPAAEAGIADGTVISHVNGVPVATTEELIQVFDGIPPETDIDVETVSAGNYAVTTTENPDDPDKSYLGVNIRTNTELVNTSLWFSLLYMLLFWISDIFYWTFLFSFGIGLANLLPLGPVDG